MSLLLFLIFPALISIFPCLLFTFYLLITNKRYLKEIEKSIELNKKIFEEFKI